jgi:predicted transcriptional regulator
MSDQPKGGFFFIPDELMEIFLPRIGCDGVVVYLALCRLLTRAGKNEGPVSIAALAITSCVSRSTVERVLRRIVELGMVRKFPNTRILAPARFELVDLKEAAQLQGTIQ